MSEYQERIQIAAESDKLERQSLVSIPGIPAGFVPWWQTALNGQLQDGTRAVQVNLDMLIVSTLQHSTQVRVLNDHPLIQQTAIVEAESDFDWTAFVQSRWDDLSDPVGNILTTGGSPRYRNNQLSQSTGLRKRNRNGGRFEAAQEFGFQNTNSVFFQPNNQGTARLRLSYTQPLLRGRGQVYNTSLVVLANIQAGIAEEEVSRELQNHLLQVTQAYWSLYLERAVLLQKQRSYLRAVQIYRNLEARKTVDVVGSQLFRVDAAVMARKSELVRAELAVRNAQDRIQALINDPELARVINLELIPMDTPVRKTEPLNAGEILATAIQMRPEINQALKEIRGGAVRLGMSTNELLPQLDLVLETYVAGLRGETNLANAWTDQFTTGEPGYSIGLQYEIPINNRGAKAQLERRQLEMRQLQNRFRVTVETLMMEAKVAAREVRSAEREYRARYHSMQAAAKRLENIEKRWEMLPGEDRSIGLYLEDVLRAQDQLTESEFGFTEAEVNYNLTLMELKRVTGTLLQQEQVQQVMAWSGDLPRREAGAKFPDTHFPADGR